MQIIKVVVLHIDMQLYKFDSKVVILTGLGSAGRKQTVNRTVQEPAGG